MASNATRLSCGLYNSTGSYLPIYTTQGGNSKPPGTLTVKLMSHSDLPFTPNRRSYRVLVTRSMAVDGNLSPFQKK